jgi:pyruvate dehydrogenase E2 component (dihydrolipoamide acetyltransferase)
MSGSQDVDIIVPQVGEAVAEVTLVRWLKAPGEHVKRGEPLFEVDTDKALVEVEAFVDGTLAEIIIPEGSAVMPQQVVGRVAPSEPGEGATVTARESEPGVPEPTEVGQRLAAELRSAPSSAGDRGGRRAFSPKARRLAESLGVNLETVRGTGPNGLVTARDVEVAQSDAGSQAAERRKLSPMRRTVAERTQASKQQVPHYYLTVDADMTEAQRLRQYCQARLGWSQRPTVTDLIVRASALALGQMPALNVRYHDGQLEIRHTVDVGVAIALDDGLVVPVLATADRVSLQATAQWLRQAAERARQGRLLPQDLAAKSLVVSNLGMYGIDSFFAIIDQPDPMILAAGRVADRLVPVHGQPAVCPMCTLSLSVDHRALDGATAARYLKRVQAHLEDPFELLGASE